MVAYRESGDLVAAEEVLNRMSQQKVTPSVVTYTELVRGYVARGDMAKAEEVVSRMRHAHKHKGKDKRSCEGTYTALLQGYKEEDQAIKVLERMAEDNIRPGDRTYDILIDACGDNVEEADRWVVRMKQQGCALTAWTYKARARVLARAQRTGAEMEALLEEVEREKEMGG